MKFLHPHVPGLSLMLLLAAAALALPVQVRAAAPLEQRDGDLRVVAYLSDDDGSIRREWRDTRMLGKPRPVAAARIGGELATVLAFAGCSQRPNGQCDLVARFALVTPAGERLDAGAGALWSAKPLPDQLMLGAARARVKVQDGWAPGRYAFEVTVTDQVSAKTIQLQLPFEVEAR